MADEPNEPTGEEAPSEPRGLEALEADVPLVVERQFGYGFTASSQGSVANSSRQFWAFLANRHNTRASFSVLAGHRRISWRQGIDYGTPITLNGFTPTILTEEDSKPLEPMIKEPREVELNLDVWHQTQEVMPQYSLRNLDRVEFSYTYPNVLFDIAIWRDPEEYSYRHILDAAFEPKEDPYIEKMSCEAVWEHRQMLNDLTVDFKWDEYDGFKKKARLVIPRFVQNRVKLGEKKSRNIVSHELPDAIKKLYGID